jgi:hypothetical protein
MIKDKIDKFNKDAKWWLYVPPSLKYINSTYRIKKVFMAFACLIQTMDCGMELQCVFCHVGTNFLNPISINLKLLRVEKRYLPIQTRRKRNQIF